MRGQSRDRTRPGAAITYQRREIKYRYADKRRAQKNAAANAPRSPSAIVPFVDRKALARIARRAIDEFHSEHRSLAPRGINFIPRSSRLHDRAPLLVDPLSRGKREERRVRVFEFLSGQERNQEADPERS